MVTVKLLTLDQLLSLGKVYGITILKGGSEKQPKRGLHDFLVFIDSNRK